MHGESRSIQEDINLEDFEGEAYQTMMEDLYQAQEKTWLDWLMTKTGDGSVGEYVDHPLNFGKEYNEYMGLARILRGLTGFLGDLDFAVIDISLGILEYMKPAGDPKGDDRGGDADEESTT